MVELIYLALPSIEMSRFRVAERVAHGGHDIPIRDIERRFSRSIHHLLKTLSNCVDQWFCFMNDGDGPVLVFEQIGTDRNILHEDYYELLLREENDEHVSKK